MIIHENRLNHNTQVTTLSPRVSMEKEIQSLMEVAELKRQDVRETMKQLHERAPPYLSFSLQWKDLDEQFQTTRCLLDDRFEDLKSREKELMYGREKVRESTEELEWKKRKFLLIENTVKERFGELETRERDVELRLCEVEAKEKEIESDANEKLKEVEAKEKEVGKWLEELRLKEKRFEEWGKEVELKDKELEERNKELELDKEKVEERLKEVELREKRNEECKLIERWIEKQVKEVELKDKQIEERYKELNLGKEKVEEKLKEVELREKKFGERLKELELRERRFFELNQSQVKKEPSENCLVDGVRDQSSRANIQFRVNMDGKSLQIYLNERCNDHDSMQHEVIAALRLSSQPAKIVLDAMQGFYPPHLKNGDVEFDGSVVKRSCILLLEQLMKLSPDIKPLVKQEAVKLAMEWRVKMRADAEHSLEVLGFLQLLASYGLASAFDSDELIKCLEKVARLKEMPGLCRALGVENIIPGFIQNLIKGKQHIEAIRFIYAFELVHQFPPVPLLKDYMKHTKNTARRAFKMGNRSCEAQSAITTKRVAGLRAVIRCIKDHKLESQYSPEDIEKQIVFLEKRSGNSKPNMLTPGHKAQPPPQSVKKCIAPIVAATGPNHAPMPPATIAQNTATAPVTTPLIPIQQHSGSKRPWTALSTEAAANTSVGSGSTSAVCIKRLSHQERERDQDFIQNLIKNKNYLAAIKHIYALELVDKFPPVRLLNDHLMYSKRKSKEFRKRGINSVKLQLKAIRIELAASRDVIRLIAKYKLETEHSPEVLEKRIAQLEKQEAEKKCECDRPKIKTEAEKKRDCDRPKIKTGPLTRSKAKLKHQHKMEKCSARTTIVTPSSASSTSTFVKTESQHQQGSESKRPRIDVSTKAPNHSVVATTSTFHPMQPPNWQPPAFCMDQSAPYLNAAPRDYSLVGHPPANLHMNPYNNNFVPYYPRDALRQPGYNDRQLHFGGPGDAISRPASGYHLPP